MYTGNCNCSHRRRIGNTILCVETDERDHSLYDKEDENKMILVKKCKVTFIM